MLDSIMGYSHVQSIVQERKTYTNTNNKLYPAQQDTVFISDEARKLMQESKMQSVSASTSNAQETESSEKSVQQKFRDYLKNPTLAHAMEKMAEVIDKIGLNEADKKEVLALVERAFRSGIPEKGELTEEALGSLRKELKKSGILSDSQLTDLMDDISDIVQWAQKEEDKENAANTNMKSV